MFDFPLLKILDPLYTLCKILGITPLTYHNRRLTISKFGLAQSILYFCAFLALTVMFFETHSRQVPEKMLTIKTISFVLVFRSIANVAFVAIIYVIILVSTRRFMEQIEQLSDLENDFEKLDVNNSKEESNKEIQRSFVFLCVVVHLVFNVSGGIIPAYIKRNDFSSVWELVGIFAVTVYPRLVVTNINLTFYVLVLVLKARFRIINSNILTKIEDSKRVRKYPTKFDFCESVKRIVDLHKALVKIAKEINSIYAVHLLVFIAVTFVLLVGDLYITTYIFFFQLPETHILIIVSLFQNVLMYGFDLFILAKYTTDLCEEANNTKRLLVRIKIDIDKEDERNAVIVGALKLGQNNLDITACKFFSIDNALLFSICGAASSYLFIMIQLDMGSNNATDKAGIASTVSTLMEYTSTTPDVN